ncbi:MAG: tRNA glutamyl-Q(34) synthetase GluQRS [Trueperella sp.]|nr:tRNA glutamyl-Q(34) synthetase GluQRS [Trueperella sp.]
MFGRFAPSPTGDFHLGNLRTGMLAWAFARYAGLGFHLRVEDLDDRSRPEFSQRQLEDLAALGVEWDEPVLYQSTRKPRYEEIFAELQARGLIYECYCTRRELAQIAAAPHTPPGAYPGTCRNLSAAQRERRRAELAELGRGPAFRLRTEIAELTITDQLYGDYTGAVDDFIIRRSDGVFSYNFVSVVDDADFHISQIVRGDDLLPSTARQAYLQDILAAPRPSYAHVPLVLNLAGQRLAKRDGAVSRRQLAEFGWQTADIIQLLAASLGWAEVRSGTEFLRRFDPGQLPREPWLVDVVQLEHGPQF